MRKTTNLFKTGSGLVVGSLFVYLAFRQIEFDEVLNAFKNTNYFLFIPAVLIMFVSHWMRSIRWQILLSPIKNIPIKNLFTALMIGYMGNFIFPAHIGELFRAYVISRNQNVSVSTTIGTIVIERIIDVFSLLIIMTIALLAYPFPSWVKQSGYIMFLVSFCLFILLFSLKQDSIKAKSILIQMLKFLPLKIRQRVINIIETFLNGIVRLKRSRDYIIVTLLSFFIWFCYWYFLHINFYAFNLIKNYSLGILASIVLLVITTISIIIPVSPGYIGTYHLLFQLSLSHFDVPLSIGLSFAIITHAINFLPVLFVGLVLSWKEGLILMKMNYLKN